MTVYKYAILAFDVFGLELPIGAKILTVQTQNDLPHIWALVDPSAEKEIRTFRLAGTGHTIKETNLDYIGTVQIRGGELVFHLFEIKL